MNFNDNIEQGYCILDNTNEKIEKYKNEKKIQKREKKVKIIVKFSINKNDDRTYEM